MSERDPNDKKNHSLDDAVVPESDVVAPVEETETDPSQLVLAEYGIRDIADLDKAIISILVVAKSKGPFESAGTFLTRRGWPTDVVSSLGEAINVLVAKKPTFVLVSVNHPNPKISKLPQVLAQAFNTKCVGFAEKTDGTSQGLLSKIRTQYKFFGAISGPSIHRQIKKIILDEYESAKAEKSSDAEFSGGGGDNNIHVSGGEDYQNRSAREFGGRGQDQSRQKTNPDAASLLKLLDGGEDGDDSALRGTTDSNDQKNGDGYGNSDGEPRGRSGIIVQKSSGPGASAGSPADQLRNAKAGSLSENSGGPGAHTTHSESGSPKDAKNSPQTSSGLTGEGAIVDKSKKILMAGRSFEVPQPKSLKPNTGTTNEEIEQPSRAGSLTQEGLDSKSHQATSEGQDDKADSALEGADPGETPVSQNKSPEASDVQSGKQDEREKEPLEAESIGLSRAVKKALEEVCRDNNNHPKFLTKTNSVGVIPYSSAAQKGYVIVAWADQAAEENLGFIEALKFSLLNFMAMEGVEASLETEFIIDVPNVDFLKWAKSGEFLIIREHEGIEIGVSFFHGRRGKVVKPPAEESMIKVGLDDLSPETSVTFRTYIKMELNKKYVLYLAEGRKISESQKKRLKTNKIDHLHINDDDFIKYRQYLTQVEVDKLVKSFTEDYGTKKKTA